ncbi:MAG TPA: LysR family transcriptional regulator [Candidatus Limnocylindrales bacterium]|nr:LysR family transcriptional regulator [Candidatus Limnocylindrales bacterium]
MQLGQIEAFLEVAQRGHMSRAAAALYVTQPALTARIASLEVELGERLFVRTGRGMALTDAGRAFLPHARRAVESLAEGTASVANVARGGTGELAIGGAPAMSTYVLPWVLARYAEAFPGIRLIVRTGHSEEVVGLVDSGAVQVGLIRELRDLRVLHLPIYEDGLVLVADPRHPMVADEDPEAGGASGSGSVSGGSGAAAATRRRVPLASIGETRLILFDRTSSYFELTSAMFRAAAVTPQGILELDNIDAAKKMVERRLGVALLPATAVADELASGALRQVDLLDAPLPRRRIEAIMRPDADGDSPILGPFLELLRTIPAYVPGAGPLRETLNPAGA